MMLPDWLASQSAEIEKSFLKSFKLPDGHRKVIHYQGMTPNANLAKLIAKDWVRLHRRELCTPSQVRSHFALWIPAVSRRTDLIITNYLFSRELIGRVVGVHSCGDSANH